MKHKPERRNKPGEIVTASAAKLLDALVKADLAEQEVKMCRADLAWTIRQFRGEI